MEYKQKRNKKLYRFFTMFVSLMFILGSANIPILANEVIRTSAKTDGAIEKKISEEVIKSFGEEEYVQVLIEFNENVDSLAVADEAVKNMKSSSKYEQKVSRGYAVVNELQRVADKSQESVLSYLEKAQKSGEVKEYKSFYIVNIVAATCTQDVVEKIAANSNVKSIVIDSKIEANWPKIEDINSLETVENAEWGVKKVKAPEVWENFGVTGQGVVVGMIDTGVEYTHEALQTKWRGYNPANPSNPNSEGNWFDAVNGRALPYDEPTIPHGSHVMGSILGQGNNGQNIIGVAPDAKYIVAKAFTPDGGQDSWLLAAAEWMLAPSGDPSKAPDVINNSWSGGPGLDEWYRPMVQAWRAAGILPVFAASNEPNGAVAQPGSVANPGNYPEAFTVGAVDVNNVRPIFTRLGPAPYDAPNDLKPDIAAPGVNVRSSVPGGYEGGWNGTSMATPHVVGTVALLLSADPSLSCDELEEAIISTATPLTDSAYPTSPNYGFGYGLVNAFEAVASISSGRGTIEGTVLTKGNDAEPAEIVDYTRVENAYAGLSIPIDVVVKDNIAVSKVELYVSVNGLPNKLLVPFSKVSGTHKEATYRAIISGELVMESGLSYEIVAYDYGKNQTKTEPVEVSVTFGIEPDAFNFDFSSEPSNWIEMDGDWQWGEIAGGKPPYEVGNKVVGTNLSGNYSDGVESWFISPPIDLRNSAGIYLSYDYWLETYAPDFGALLVTNDFGENWTILAEYKTSTATWQKEILAIDQFANSETPLFIAFAFASNASTNRLGLYLDNIVIGERNEIAPAIPTGLSAEAGLVGVTLTWDAVEDFDAHGYKVYRALGNEEPTLIGATRETNLLDAAVSSDTTYNYFVSAVDIFGNESAMSEPLQVRTPVAEVVYFEDFNEDNGGYVSNNSATGWQWGEPTGTMAPYSGGKVWTTNLTGDYGKSMTDTLETPEIDLTNVANPTLILKEYINTENKYDSTKIEIFADGQWNLLRELKEPRTQWNNSVIPLSQYGNKVVKLRFSLTADSTVSKDGWYIDDVRILSLTVTPDVENWYDKPSIDSGYEKDQEVLSIGSFNIVDRLNGMYEENLVLEKAGYLPVESVVTVLETGKTVAVDPVTGKYSFRHAANSSERTEWTVQASSYGYNTATQKVTIADEETKVANFVLDKTPTASIIGTVVNDRTGEPISGAYVKLVEDPRITPIVTDENGRFQLVNVLEGQWTVAVTCDGYSKQVIQVQRVAYEDNTVTVEMKPFVGYQQEIIYDDGTEENAMAVKPAGGGMAKRITPNGSGLLKGMKVKIYSTAWPTPGGTELKFAVMECKPDMTPGDILYITEPQQVVRGDWNTIDLSGFNYMVDGDFFLATVQTDVSTNSPGICVDESDGQDGRNFLFANGQVQAFDATDGNLMIRALVEQELSNPTITSHGNLSYTNKDTVEIRGTVLGDCKVKVYVNDEVAAEVQAQNKEYAATISLPEGTNTIKVTALVDVVETDPTSITIIKDTILPEIQMTSPLDDFNSNKESVDVIGTVTEQYLNNVTVNGKVVSVDNSGKFTTKVIVPQGRNVITIVATDLAGNESVKEIIVNTNLNGPTIYDIEPSEDIVVANNEQITVSFRSNVEGGKASFKIDLTGNELNAQNGIAMNEVEPGYYVGTYTVPENISVTKGSIVVSIEDQYGNKAQEVAPGTITTGTLVEYPVEIIELGAREEFGSIIIEGTIGNVINSTVNPTLVIMVQDSSNRVINISLARISKLEPGKIITLGSGFEKPAAGTYKVKAFVWNNLNDMEPMSRPSEITLTIN